MSHTALVTLRRPLRLASASAVSAAAEVNVFAAVTTPPASTANRVIIPGVANYLKVIPMYSGGTPSLKVVGWSPTADGRWVPNTLATVGTSTLNGTALITGLFGVAKFAALTVGDAKVLHDSGTGTPSNGLIIVDTFGSDWIELQFIQSAAGQTANAWVGEI